MSVAILPTHKGSLSVNGKMTMHTFVVIVCWMAVTSILGALIVGLVTDGILRNLLENKERELLASRSFSLSIAYRDKGVSGVERLLYDWEFKHDYVQLTNSTGQILASQNPGHIQLTNPLRPMPTIDGLAGVRDWKETSTDQGIDYDLFSRHLSDGSTLLMGISEAPQERFFERVEKIVAKVGGGFIAAGIIGAVLLIFQFRQEQESK